MSHPFVAAYKKMIHLDNIGITDKALLILLKFHCGNNGHCWPSIPTLRKELGAKKDSTVYRSLNNLINLGLIKRTTNPGKPNNYEVTPSSNSTTLLATPSSKVPTFKPQTPSSKGGRKELKEKNIRKEKNKNTKKPDPPKDPEIIKAELDKIDLVKKRQAYPTKDVNRVWEKFYDDCLTGTAKNPEPNPYNYCNFSKGFNTWLERSEDIAAKNEKWDDPFYDNWGPDPVD